LALRAQTTLQKERDMATGQSKAGEENTSKRDLEDDVRQLREDVARLMEHIRQTGGDSARVARHAMEEGVEQMRQHGESTIRHIKSGAREIEHEIAETLRERPITSLAVAAGIGYLLALLSRR